MPQDTAPPTAPRDTPAPSGRPPGIRPLRIAALVLFLLLGTGVVVLGPTFERLMVNELTAMSRDHAIDLAEAVRADVREHLLAAEYERGDSGAAASHLSKVRLALDTAISTLPVVKLHVYAADGTILLSTDPAAEGELRVDNPRFRAALSGMIDSSMTDQTEFRQGDRLVVRDHVLATYLPIRAAGPGSPVIGVLEVYQDISAAIASINDTATRLTVAAGAVMVALYLALLLAARHLDRLVRAQHDALQRESSERQEAVVHLRRVQDAMETTILERTQRLRESEARFRDFAESASDWLWETDEQGRFTYISDGFRRIVGLDPVVVLGRKRSDVVELSDPEEHERWHQHEDELRTRRAFRDFRHALLLPDGQRRTVISAGTPIIDERGRFRGYRGTTSDITGREQAEQTIIRLGRIVDQSANEVYIFDAGTLRFSQVNRGARRNLGLAMEALAEMTPLDIMPLETEASLFHRLEPLRLKPSASSVFDSVFARQDGTRYPVEVRLQYMAHERPAVYVAVVQDITERRQAEQALLESEERYRAIAEMSLDAIVVHSEGEIVFVNRQAMTIAGGETIDALIGQPLSRYVHPDYLGMVTERLRGLTATGRPTERAEVVLLRQDGTPFDSEMSSTAIAFGGRPAIQTIIRDISENKAVQSQLIQTAKLATLGEMAAGMAHELSQPMNVIRMAAEGVLLGHDQGAETLSAPVQKALGIITSQAGRMGEIIDHMRIFSRKEAEAEEVFDPGLCVRQSLNMVEAQFYAEDISVTARYPDGPCAVRGRPVHLEQVLLNLLTNARDAIRARIAEAGPGAPAGRIAIDMQTTDAGEAAGDAAADAQAPEGHLVIAIGDNGGGIPGEALDRVFEPFYTTKEVGTGTGLGLSVSFGLIAGMNGTISAVNIKPAGTAPGGARFEIRLPLADPALALTRHADGVPSLGPPPARAVPAAADLPEDDDEPSALQVHILVVDDEPFATKLIADHLSYLGYRVTTAGDGIDAYDKFLADPPDLMITDLRMPRSDGAELMRRVHSHVPDLPVIMVTGHLGHLEEDSQTLGEEAVAVVKKPISLLQLARLVREHAGEPGLADAQ